MTLAACDDDNGGGNPPDFSANDDLSMKGGMDGGDMSMETPGTAQMVTADVSGNVWVAFMDGGVKLPDPLTPTSPATVHQLTVQLSFPGPAGTGPFNGTALNGCTWDRYDLTTGKLPAPDENAGTVKVSGYDSTFTVASDALMMKANAPPDPNINCAFDGTSMHFACHFGASAADDVTRYIFVEVPNPSPTPGPTIINHDLFFNSTGINQNFTAATSGTTYTDSRNLTLPSPLPKAPHIVAINGDTSKHSLEDLNGMIGTGATEIDVDYSCDGTNTKGAGCSPNAEITGFLIQTSLGHKWESFDPGASNAKFGIGQCIDTDAGTSTHTIKMTTQMLGTLVGAQTKQSIRLVFVRLRANPQVSGAHQIYATAGRGTFAFVDQ
jgi:hypothetical protein